MHRDASRFASCHYTGACSWHANKGEGGAIVGVWVHTSGWSMDLKVPWLGRSFRSLRFDRVLSP
jgi:hypothetical protein